MHRVRVRVRNVTTHSHRPGLDSLEDAHIQNVLKAVCIPKGMATLRATNQEGKISLSDYKLKKAA